MYDVALVKCVQRRQGEASHSSTGIDVAGIDSGWGGGARRSCGQRCAMGVNRAHLGRNVLAYVTVSGGGQR